MKNVFFINTKVSVLYAFILLLAAPYGIAFAANKSVITSVSYNEPARVITVTWNQLEPVEQCYLEVTASNLNYYFSPTPIPMDPGYVPCGTVGIKTGQSDLSPPVFDQGPLYTVIVDNIAGDNLSDYLLFKEGPSSINPPPKGLLGHRPEVSIDSPKPGGALGPTTTIRYGVLDFDDYDYPPFGLGDKPVEIFYSDDRENWISIVKDLSKSGEYPWKSSDIPDGNYWIKIKATDQSADNDEEIAGPFPIDRVLPSFEIFADPSVSKGEKVKIFAIASEELQKSPQVFAKQRNYVDIEIGMRAANFGEIRLPAEVGLPNIATDTIVYLGEYEVRPGFDGTAQIKISGRDKAGNAGNIIKRGGTFSVGIQPPPPPVVIEPLAQEIFVTSTITVRGGQVREDTKVVLIVNEFVQDSVLLDSLTRPSLVGRFETRPGPNGNFLFETVPLSETFNNGENILKIYAEDAAGNTSEPVILTIKRNVEPEINIVSPVPGAIIAGTTTISFFAKDKNLDKLLFDIEASNDGGHTWSALAKDFPRQSFEWLTFLHSDGKYILRVTAFDGIAKVIATSSPFIVRNNIPGIIFSDEKPTISNTGNISILAHASSSVKRIINVDYRLQGLALDNIRLSLEDWQTTEAVDGSFDGLNERFQISFQGLPEGSYELTVRAGDNRRFYGYGQKQIIIDFGPPPAPSVRFPLDGKKVEPLIVSDSDDQDSEKAGVQILIGGKAEKNNIIEIFQDSVLAEKRPSLGKISGKSDNNGNFSISITLRQHGQNIFKIKAIDRAGNSSPEKEFSIIYNNPPAIRAVEPRDGDGIGGKAKITWEAQDKDLDPILGYNLFWRPFNQDSVLAEKRPSLGWSQLAAGLKTPEFTWDVSKFPEGFYELKIEASDGTSIGEKILKLFVDNTKPQVLPNFTMLRHSESFDRAQDKPRSELVEPIREESLTKIFFNTKDFRLQFTGSATDNFSGIQAVEYRIVKFFLRQAQDKLSSNNKNNILRAESRSYITEEWLKSVITSGFRENRAIFRVSHPFKLNDGEYEIQVRAVDVAGNISETKSQKITIDTTPPRIGPTQVLYKEFEILPNVKFSTGSNSNVYSSSEAKSDLASREVNNNIIYEILEGAEITIRQSFESDTIEAKVRIGETEYPLQKSAKTGVWETIYKGSTFAELQRWNLDVLILAEDAAGNKVEKSIGQIKVLKKGIVVIARSSNDEAISNLNQRDCFATARNDDNYSSVCPQPISDAKITVKIHNPDQKQFVNWNAEEYGEQNPLVTNQNGQYSLFLTPGTYKIEVRKQKYQTQTTKEFTVENSKFINFDFELKPRKGIKGFIQNLWERYFE